MTTPCRICGGPTRDRFQAREMMFGTRSRHTYASCAECGCLQLEEVPALDRHYPENYYAYSAPRARSRAKNWLRELRNRGVFAGSALGRVLATFWPYPIVGARRWFDRMGRAPDLRILDVGCGSGDLVRDLEGAGFIAVTGIDPYLPEAVARHAPPNIRRQRLEDVRDTYDVVMAHHVLEHLPQPVDALRQIARVLRAGGWCLIRTPVVPNEAFERYRENWVQLDAPRHVFIHSAKSLELLASRAGLELVHVEHDSTEFQFVGSERYRRDVALVDSFDELAPRVLREFRARARDLNASGRGDQAAFYFRKVAAADASDQPRRRS